MKKAQKTNNARKTAPARKAPAKAKPALSRPNATFAKFHSLSPLSLAPRAIVDGVNEDPVAEEPVQVQHREDKYEVTLDYAACLSQREFFARGGKPHRIHWRMPVATQKIVDGDITLDSRGILSDVQSAHISFTNTLQDDIEVVVNTPIARIKTPDEIAARIGQRKFRLKPGQTSTYKASWKADVNLYQPLIQTVKQGTEAHHAIVVADYAVVVPDVSAQSNTAYSVERDVCVCKVNMRYVAEAVDEMLRGPNVKLVRSDAFSLSTLANVNAMINVEGEIISSALGGRATALASGVVQWIENTTQPCFTLERLDAGGNQNYIKLIRCDKQGRFTGNVEIAPYQGDIWEAVLPIGFGISPEMGRARNDMFNYCPQLTFRYNRSQGAWLLNGTTYGEPFKIDNGYFDVASPPFPICSAKVPITLYDTRATTYDEEGRAVDPLGPYAFDIIKFMKGTLEVVKIGAQVASILAAFA